MLHKCQRDQWSVGDLDWNRQPKELSPKDEEAIVQYFTDMAGIERLAGALFNEQRKRTDDPTLATIFESFVVDEVRHAHAAQMLADFYNVHHFRIYQMNESMLKFTPHFINSIRYLTPEVANTYITIGEIILDIALLRSLNDFVDDDMSQEAMHLINRDESRHIAVDYYMADYYSSPEYVEQCKHRPRKPLSHQLKAWWSFANVLFYAAPFFKQVFFRPMDLTDPTGKRMLEAFKRVQLLANKSRVSRRPFVRFMLTLQGLFNHPVVGLVFGRILLRVIGVEPQVLATLYSEAELKRAEKMSMDEMAQETLALKYVV
jgi:hypothetical protein